MKEYKLAIIGFGNVGQGFAHILAERGALLERSFGARFTIVAVSDILKGSLANPGGISPAALLEAIQRTEKIEQLSAPAHGWDALKTIQESAADVIIETSYTDLKSGQPAISHIEAALKNGKHAVTSNKGPAALRYAALQDLARQNGITFCVEGTVMSGTPALRLGLDYLKAAGIRRVQGILNGTTNYILTQMQGGASYSSALEDAHELGYAEADPTADVEGFDTAGKVVILANLLLGAEIGMEDVERRGITTLTLEDIRTAQEAGECWKLIGAVEEQGGKIVAEVNPTRLPLTHPLASVSGATNAITYTTDLLGDVTLIGAGAGRLETGYAILADLLAIHDHNR
jgi:homoserine dehydrogenase